MTSILGCPKHGLWRKAVSLLVVTLGRNNQPKVLTVKRSGRATFMPNHVVFPGGLCEPADFSLQWVEKFPSLREFKDDPTASFPDIFTNDSESPAQELSAHIGFRIGAIRELFEETGLLLDSTGGFCKVSEEWRKNVDGNPDSFIKMFEDIGRVPGIFQLHNWSVWLTPVGLKNTNRRYDTQFYIAFVEDIDELELSEDEKEVTQVKFFEVEELLNESHKGSLILGPPQIYELSRLLNFSSITELKTYSLQRDELGIERIYPVRITCSDGYIVVFPGDCLYPEVPDLEGKYPPLNINMTVERCNEIYPRHHRTISQSGKPLRIKLNIELPLKQKSPKTDFFTSRL